MKSRDRRSDLTYPPLMGQTGGHKIADLCFCLICPLEFCFYSFRMYKQVVGIRGESR